MVKRKSSVTLICIVFFTVLSAGEALGQADPQNYLFNTGQSVQPYFEGWSHNSDGSFEMHFGYLNRNYVDPIHVPIGSNNRFNSGPTDQGQPTFFYPRVNRRVFSVTVPDNFGEQEVVWSITVDDETNHAVGWLQAGEQRQGDLVKFANQLRGFLCLGAVRIVRLRLSDRQAFAVRVSVAQWPSQADPAEDDDEAMALTWRDNDLGIADLSDVFGELGTACLAKFGLDSASTAIGDEAISVERTEVGASGDIARL